MRGRDVIIVAIAAGALAIAGLAHALPQSMGAVTEADANGPQATRPADLATWPSLGTTMRMNASDLTVPWQMRHMQIEPGAYQTLLRTSGYPDGAVLTATMSAVQRDSTHSPHLYRATQEVALGMEVIDRAHPDGRRFYIFTPGAATAAPLPAGNSCAACHAARGTFDGTFAHMYPTISRFAEGRE